MGRGGDWAGGAGLLAMETEGLKGVCVVSGLAPFLLYPRSRGDWMRLQVCVDRGSLAAPPEADGGGERSIDAGWPIPLRSWRRGPSERAHQSMLLTPPQRVVFK